MMGSRHVEKYALFMAFFLVMFFIGISSFPLTRTTCLKSSTRHQYPLASSSTSSSNLSQCPFVKFFPKYRIELISRGNKKLKDNQSSWLPSFLPSFGGSPISKRQVEAQLRPGERLVWEPQVDKVTAFAKLWEEVDILLPHHPNSISSVVIALPDASTTLVENWTIIFNWMVEKCLVKEESSISFKASLMTFSEKNSSANVVRIEREGAPNGDGMSPFAAKNETNIDFSKAIINQRTQSWVKRVLVEQGICPFTKSVKMSGQGLADVGVPVGSIAYHASGALHPITLFVDTFRAMEEMLQAGPSGKDGVSSILLAAPGFDEDFDLWSGPIFAMLEASVVAAMAESQLGVVCFHPKYACPDGSSWPGFGHMHSVPRLEKWYQEAKSIPGSNSAESSDCHVLSTEDVAAGGAWQRRTPHATINVLRADQLEKAEAKRSSGDLYAVNIEKLVGPTGIGSTKLSQDLAREQQLS